MESRNEIEAHTTVTNDKIVEVYIKEEPLEETSQDDESYENGLLSIKKEEYITNNDKQIDSEYENPFTINEDIRKTINTNYQIFEEVYIKEGPLEENPQDGEFYENVLQNVKKEEEYTTDNNKQMDKESDNTVFEINDIQETENINSNRFCCAVCNKSFMQKASLRRHVKTHTGIRTHKCPTCDKSFTQSSHFKEHLITHSGIKAYNCPICNKSFTKNSSLKIHMKIHTGAKAYKCPTCSKSFIQNSNLKEHMKIHSGIRAYKCSTCNKSFTQNSTLKAHLKTHSGKKDLKCTVCNKLFIHRRSLTRHMEYHRDKYQCSACEISFTNISNRKRHVDKFHSPANNSA